MSKKDENIFQTNFLDEDGGKEEIVVNIGTDNKITNIYLSSTEMRPVSTVIEGDPHNEDCIMNVENAFKMMMEYDVESFKNMLRKIQAADPEFYQMGLQILQSKREELHRVAEEAYTL